MAELEIRALREGELRAFLNTVSTAFGEELPDDEFASSERIFEPDRVYVAEDGGRIVGGGGSFSFELTVPGGATIGAAGVTAVGTLPTHRRRGALRGVMRELLADARRHEDAVAILWASEGSIYQRFGFGLSVLVGEFSILKGRAGFLVDLPRCGEVRLVTPEEAAELFPPLFDAVRGQTPGLFVRSSVRWAEMLRDSEFIRRGAGPKYLLVHEVDGAPEGYAIYRFKPDWSDGAPNATLLVREIVATTARSERALWRYCLSMDLVHTVRGSNQRADHPLLLMLAEPARLRLVLGDGLWLRVVDVARALAARSYGASDRLVLELSDAFQPDLAGRWLLDTTGDRPHVARTKDAANLALDANDLACLYLGQFSASQLAAAGRTTALTPGAHARADALFTTRPAPWSPTPF